jgi:hypothetical protein
LNYLPSQATPTPPSEIASPATVSSPTLAIKAQIPLQIGDMLIVSNGAINGYASPAISAKRLKEYAEGTIFEITVIMKDFFRVRDKSGLEVWVGRRGVTVAQPPDMAMKPNPTSRGTPSTLATNSAQPPPPSPAVQTVISPTELMTAQVNCKLGTLPPVRTTAEKCKLINGSEVE